MTPTGSLYLHSLGAVRESQPRQTTYVHRRNPCCKFCDGWTGKPGPILGRGESDVSATCRDWPGLRTEIALARQVDSLRKFGIAARSIGLLYVLELYVGAYPNDNRTCPPYKLMVNRGYRLAVIYMFSQISGLLTVGFLKYRTVHKCTKHHCAPNAETIFQ
jgi:hypothetical protein